jgi:hypothetical protein
MRGASPMVANATGVLVRCKLCSVPGHMEEHHRFGCHHVGGAVSWNSKKQATTATSTMDAEHQACGAAAREGLSLMKAHW